MEKLQKLDAMKNTLQARIEKNLAERKELMKEALSSKGTQDAEHFISKGIPQSLLFMAELIPHIHSLYEHEPENITKTVLDVGPQNMAGTALLRDIHSVYSYNRLKLHVEALDITDDFIDFGRVVAPGINLILSDIFDLRDRTWDFLIASHVIEHVPDPIKFVARLQSLAKDFVLIACPWREFPITTQSHVNTIDKEFTRKVGARGLKVFTNYSWGKRREVCIFWVPGTAQKV
ncbi:hypothetical protein AJ87_24190 [Rhizobium yanglingense]|nr:hypothetical protein AJ87_24190 [Rhizobium yanglingense]